MRSLSDLFRDVMQLAYVTEDSTPPRRGSSRRWARRRCHTKYKSSLGGVVVVDGEPAEEWVIDVALVNAGADQPGDHPARSAAPSTSTESASGRACRRRSTTSASGSPTSTRRRRCVAASGRSWKQYGNFGGSVRFGYVDMTAELGHFVEVMEVAPAFEAYLTQLEAESNAGR